MLSPMDSATVLYFSLGLFFDFGIGRDSRECLDFRPLSICRFLGCIPLSRLKSADKGGRYRSVSIQTSPPPLFPLFLVFQVQSIALAKKPDAQQRYFCRCFQANRPSTLQQRYFCRCFQANRPSTLQQRHFCRCFQANRPSTLQQRHFCRCFQANRPSTLQQRYFCRCFQANRPSTLQQR